VGLVLFAAFSASPNYQLNSYGVGSGGTSNSSSSTYHLQGSAGEQANGSTAGTTYTAKNGSVQTEQLNVPPAPTLDTGSGTYYNKLGVTVNTGNNPSDTTYSIAVSTNNFVTTNYVQADGTLGVGPIYQLYTAWGGSSGTFITGLTSSTTYKVKVDAKQGMFTNTAYSAAASAATVAPSITFSLSPNSTTLSNLLPATVVSSSPDMTVNMATNAASGGSVYVSGQNNGLKSLRYGYIIAAFTGDLAGTGEGFGVQLLSPTQVSGGPFSAVSPFGGTGTVVAAESTVPAQVLHSNAPVVGGSATARLKAKAAQATPAAGDYQEILTFVASANF